MARKNKKMLIIRRGAHEWEWGSDPMPQPIITTTHPGRQTVMIYRDDWLKKCRDVQILKEYVCASLQHLGVAVEERAIDMDMVEELIKKLRLYANLRRRV